MLFATELPDGAVDGLGVNIHFTDARPGEMPMLAQGGFRWIRMDFAWSAIEREKGKYDFSAYDRLMKTLDEYHMRAILILDYGNGLYDKGVAPASDEARAAFARWAAASVRHFRNRGVLWEMYNEPNCGFWTPKPDVHQYTKLALAVGKALRDAEPNEAYIGPATSGIDFAFLEECFKAGLLDYWSAVSVHPYRQEMPETAAAEYDRLKKMIQQYAKGKSVPVISGEWGFSSTWKDFDETRQGKYLPRQWLTNVANRIPVSIWYDWHDDGMDPKEPEHHFGTVHHPYLEGKTPVYEPKPAYLAAQTLAKALAGRHFTKRLPVGGKDDYVLAFSNGDDVCIAAWTTANKPHTVTIPLPTGTYNVVGHTGQVMPAVTADAKGVSLSLTDAPTYLSGSK
jgi:hypothetical protein